MIILYRPVWQSNTGGGWNFAPVNPHPSCEVGSGTGWTGVLGVGQCFVSPNGRFELLLQSDGELVIYDRSVTPNKVLWSN